uniref:Uncharacterized protein ycf35 n=1 Tax=Cyanophora paradoxa TaxID=2762 RepID=YCF35_CYAPA|nr:Ycf35 [Cyanophora paradoxa]P48275.1 RecName: Full=Uncharacterized protein ycf35 [Cyanophora paradoxa]AAA81309.1 ycf35 [Cyanophora paradoxa]
MSHLTQVQTNIVNEEALKKALNALNIKWQDGPQNIKNLYGQEQTVDILIKQKNNFDIGFVKEELEYKLIADLQYWEQPYTVETFLQQLKQQYAYQIILDETINKGFEKLEEEYDKDGSIRLVVQRWRY